MKEQKNSKGSNQQIYRIRVFKDFDIPSFSVDKRNLLSDLSYRSLEEVRENFQHPEYFNFEVINVMPFTLKTEINETTGNADYDFFIREIALDATREKFGELNYEKNPDLFEKREETATSVTFHLREDVEHFYVRQLQRISNLLNTKRISR